MITYRALFRKLSSKDEGGISNYSRCAASAKQNGIELVRMFIAFNILLEEQCLGVTNP